MKKLFVCLSALFMLLVSCSPFTLVNSSVYNESDLANYKTFRIVTTKEGKIPAIMGLVGYHNIAAAIREQMIERGYTEDENSQLLVNIALTVDQKIETEPAVPPGYYPGYRVYNGRYPYYMYPRYMYMNSYYSNAKVITGIYKEGVLTMEFVDMTKMLPLYSSSVSTILESGDDQLRNLSGIAEAVQVLFSKFPVPLLPQYQTKK